MAGRSPGFYVLAGELTVQIRDVVTGGPDVRCGSRSRMVPCVVGAEQVCAPVVPQMAPHGVHVVGVVLGVVVLDEEVGRTHAVVVTLAGWGRPGPREPDPVEARGLGVAPAASRVRRRRAVEVAPDQLVENFLLRRTQQVAADSLGQQRGVGHRVGPGEDVVGSDVGADAQGALVGIEPGRQLAGQVLFRAEDPAAGVRPGGYDGRLGADEMRRERRTAWRHNHVDGQVVAVDPPAPRLLAVRIAEHPQPVAVAVGR